MTTLHPGAMPSHPRRASGIALGEPLLWLSHGLQDLRRVPFVGLAMG